MDCVNVFPAPPDEKTQEQWAPPAPGSWLPGITFHSEQPELFEKLLALSGEGREIFT